jgi:hypothetical protein
MNKRIARAIHLMIWLTRHSPRQWEMRWEWTPGFSEQVAIFYDPAADDKMYVFASGSRRT